MSRLKRGGLFLIAFLLPALPVLAQEDTLRVQGPEVVVSATRTPRKLIELPNQAHIVTGTQLRRSGALTLGQALQDVVGVDTGDGSDNGARFPNVGMWGLKEFDALLFTLNGVPVGGPFNPSLAQIPVDDVERIEIVKGPQGTMYGVSAFAGMIQVFTQEEEGAHGRLTAGGGSFSQGQGNLSWGKALGEGRHLRLAGTYQRTDGWQDRTESDRFRGSATLGLPLGRGHMALDVVGLSDNQDWGTAMPIDAGAPVPGFEIDRNYAIHGAEVKHQVVGGNARFSLPVGSGHRFENTLSFVHDDQSYLRSFPDSIGTDGFVSLGLQLEPEENSVYEDARMVFNLNGRGAHELVAGLALTLGETKGKRTEFEFDQEFADDAGIPSFDQIAASEKEQGDFEDKRLFLGVYAHDAWTPMPRLTLEAGGRYDLTSEELETEADLPGGPTLVKDTRDDHDFSGDVSVLYRLLSPEGGTRVQAANLYGSVRRAFKPAAPNLAEAEAAEILEPENTVSWEVGIKTRSGGQVALDASYFDMKFENMVVAILGSGGAPELTNAGEQRFRGFETSLRWTPTALPGTAFDVGYANHSARFVDFSFATPDGEIRNVSGNRLELVPGNMFNARASVHMESGPGAFVAARFQGDRPLNRRNTFFTDAYTEWDAGVSYERNQWLVTVVGRNLGDDRHPVTESEIGDSQFYLAAPRRVTGQVSYHF